MESPGWTGKQQIEGGGEKKRRGGRKESQGVGVVGREKKTTSGNYLKHEGD